MSTPPSQQLQHETTLKHRLFDILEGNPRESGPVAKVFDVFIIGLIFLNVIAVTLETVEWLHDTYTSVFLGFEAFSVTVFTVEYVLRLWTCTTDRRFTRPLAGRLRFARSPLGLVDLLAILPYYLPLVGHIDLRFMRVIRLLRVFLLLKMVRYSSSLKAMGNVLREEQEELVITAFLLGILLVLSSSSMYFIEHEAQPKLFSSIPAAMWWGVTTLTTVGYGDAYPITPLGKFVGGIIALAGIGVFALPAAILSSGFVEEMHKHRRKHVACPHCGKDIHADKL